jgi:predicted enzyme related to lactoylglutathione lyase
MTQTGRVVWHDCMTLDMDKSIDFYGKLFGWTTQDFDPGNTGKPYTMIVSGDATIGGYVPMDPAETDSPPPHWMSYVAVDDVEAALQRTTAAGGTICVPPIEIPTVGKFAVIADPTGGYISPFQSANEPQPELEGPSPVGQFIWEELLTTDPVAATAFYSELFGWKTQEMDMGEMGTYRVQLRGETPESGIMQKPADAPGPSHWLSYVHVEDVDATAAKVNGFGGKTFVPPMDMPDVGRMSVHSDSVGCMFALYKPAATSC